MDKTGDHYWCVVVTSDFHAHRAALTNKAVNLAACLLLAQQRRVTIW